MNICKAEIVETSTVERTWLDSTRVLCENIIREANDPRIVGSAELVVDGINDLLSHVVTKTDF